MTEAALVDAYEADKTILDSYGDTVFLKRRRDDDDDDQEEGPSAGSDRGSKRQREGKEPESASAPLETATRSTSRSTTGSKSRQVSASKSAFAGEPHSEWFSQPKKPLTPDHDWNKTLPAVQGSTQTWISKVAKQADSCSSFNELLDTPLDFSNFIMNQLRVNTLTPELLAGPTFELMKGSCTSLIELEYHLEEVYKGTTDQLDWEPINYDKHALWGVSHCGRKRQQFYSDGMLNDVRNALDDRLKGIRMEYLPTEIWRKGDKDRAAAMIQAIDKMLKTRRIIRSWEKFVGGRL
nr:hypothetical protein [Tanacetum cinerariifolium]